MSTEDTSFDWYRVQDPHSGCRVELQRMADGRFSIRYDCDEEVTLKSEEELFSEFPLPEGVRILRWIPYEMLRQHVNTAHPDMSYVDLAAR